MKRIGPWLAILVGIALLAALRSTMPGFATAFGPFDTVAASGAPGRSSQIEATFEQWQQTPVLRLHSPAGVLERQTDGVFLLASMVLHSLRQPLSLSAQWRGRSGRIYDASKRVGAVPELMPSGILQPGLETRVTAVFEVPPDEIEGGALMLTGDALAPLSARLVLAPPAGPPQSAPVDWGRE